MTSIAKHNIQETGVRYSAKSPLPLLAFRDNHEDALPVQPGEIVTIWNLPEDERFVLVVVDGQEFHAFASDVTACCETLASHSHRRMTRLFRRAAAA